MWQIDANVPWQMSLPELSTSHSAAMLDLMEESAAPLFAVGRLDLAGNSWAKGWGGCG